MNQQSGNNDGPTTYAAAALRNNFITINNDLPTQEKTCFFTLQDAQGRPADYRSVVQQCCSAFGNKNIACVQNCGRGKFLISFKTEEIARKAVEQGLPTNSGVVTLTNIQRRSTVVHIKNAPYEYENEFFEKLLSAYGQIDRIEYIYLDGDLSHIATGDRRVIINMTRPIPNIIRLGNLQIFFIYRGVQRMCRTCAAADHLQADCPNKLECTKCSGIGHTEPYCRICEICQLWKSSEHVCQPSLQQKDDVETSNATDCTQEVLDSESSFFGASYRTPRTPPNKGNQGGYSKDRGLISNSATKNEGGKKINEMVKITRNKDRGKGKK